MDPLNNFKQQQQLDKNSWVQFDDHQTSSTINNNNNNDNDKDNDNNNNINDNNKVDDLKTNDNNNRNSAIENTNNNNNDNDSQQQQQQFATIDLSANTKEIHHPHHQKQQQINNLNNNNNNNDKNQSNHLNNNLNNNSTSNNSNNNSKSGFNNGDIIVTLYPLNDNCAWLTPATFKAHLVPEELMAQPLTLTVEDYVSTMSILLSDYRFHLYITLHKRILALWITLSIIILLGILASGTKGLPIFLSGICWLILNALGIFLVIFIKSKLYRMLEECISQINSIFSRHNIFLGIDDRGHFSCHKINLIFVYFDSKYCIKFLQDMLKNQNNKNIPIHQQRQQQQQNDLSILNNDDLINNDDIYITGSGGTKQISQKEKQAEKLLYRYSQRWIREYGRQRMTLSIFQSSQSQQPEQQLNNQTTNQTNNQTVTIPIPNNTDIPPRHCRQAKCFCQYIEELYRGKQQQKQQQSFGQFCFQSFFPCFFSSSQSRNIST